MANLLRNRSRVLVFTGAAAALAGAGAACDGTGVFASASAQAASASTPGAAHAGPAKPATAPPSASARPAVRGRTAAVKLIAARKPHAAKPRKATSKPRVARVRRGASTNLPWKKVQAIVARESSPSTARGQQAMADQLRPVGASGPQEYMPMTPARMANATTIVKQALAQKMGLRSAVIAVATSMQESTLENLHYGTSDSLGLFQQRPSCGWGTAAQITDPAYAARAFLTALHKYQATDPAWASQPLWQSAQGVQASGYPTAYAKWEAQASSIVQHVTTHLV
jgi:hypothetical protein